MLRAALQCSVIQVWSRSYLVSPFKVCTKKFYNKYLIRFDGISVTLSGSTTFEHDSIYHLAKYLGQPFTTGSGDPYHAKTEIMRLESGEWKSGPDYPFDSR